MIEIDGKLFNRDHISAVMPGAYDSTTIVTLGGEWISVRRSYASVKAILDLAEACRDIGCTQVHDG